MSSRQYPQPVNSIGSGLVLPFRRPGGDHPFRAYCCDPEAARADCFEVQVSAADMAVVTSIRRACLERGLDVSVSTVLSASLHGLESTPPEIVAEYITENLFTAGDS